ncbi:AAA family ATPase [Variovorax sp. UMC13]|uniref:AAA family ATPase n=1 Tax=Variovorax sp. UMC13 TaxID=1862326 RepID=UPI001602B3B0|nr:AAA family ATPase [Variovorax sp. UMC13]
MDKSVVFAVAGSGKTTKIVQQLDEKRRYLLITYTDANRDNLRRKILERFGNFPTNIKLLSYFKFLHSFCYRPFLRSEKNTRGLLFTLPPVKDRYALTDDRRFMSATRRLYSNRLAKFVEQTGTVPPVVARLEKYFDAVYVDEIQDFAGHDFNLLLKLVPAKVEFLFVGDFYQHTYDTSRDGSINNTLHDDYKTYRSRFKAAGMRVDLESLKASRRCSKNVCDFISEKIGIAVDSSGERISTVRFEDNQHAVEAIYADNAIVKLFYQEHYKYGCYSENWGASKGLDHFNDVCIVLSAPNVKAWKNDTLKAINPGTKNKLYVACSRARGDLTFVPEALLKKYKKTACA